MIKFEVVEIDNEFNIDAYARYSGIQVSDHNELTGAIYPQVSHPLYNVDQFSLEPIMYSYFLSRPRAVGPEQTEHEVWYLPVFLGLMGLADGDSNQSTLFQKAVSLITKLALSSPEKTFLLPLSRIYRYYSIWPWQIKLPDNILVLSIERYMPNKNVICVPYPSNYYYTSDKDALSRANLQQNQTKTSPACFFGRRRRDDHPRSQIIEMLEKSALTECISSFTADRRKHLLSNESVAQLDDLRRRSWISIEPPGDSPSRKGIFDALLSFSIPLLFESGRYDYPFSNVFPWERICFFIDGSDEWRLMNKRKSIDAMISAISEDEIKRRIADLSRHVRLLQYTPPNARKQAEKDAFYAIEIEIECLMRKRNMHNLP